MAAAVSMNQSEHKRRERRKDSYHLVASRNRLPADPEDREEDVLFNYLLSPQMAVARQTDHTRAIRQAKTNLLVAMASSGGDVTTAECAQAIETLTRFNTFVDVSQIPAEIPPNASPRLSNKPQLPPRQMEGMWIDISKAKYQDCLGTNGNGDYQYTLGRMSFDKFRPADLVCSLQGSFNPIHVVKDTKQLPAKLAKELQKRQREGHETLVRSYNIVTAITIEPSTIQDQLGITKSNATVQRPIEGLMTTYGYVLCDREQPNRLSTWFVGGTLEVVNPENTSEWCRLLKQSHMETDGRISYNLPKPVDGAFIDVVYMDETLRIVRSSHDMIYVFARVPYFPDE